MSANTGGEVIQSDVIKSEWISIQSLRLWGRVVVCLCWQDHRGRIVEGSGHRISYTILDGDAVYCGLY